MALIGLAAAAVLVAGCGGGDHLSKDELIKQGDALCLQQRAADQKIGATQSVKTLAAKGDELLASDRAALDRFAKLKPPSDLQGKFDAYVKRLRQSLQVEADLVAAAKKGDTTQLRKALLAIQAVRPQLATGAHDVGFRSCSQASG
jgi:hypothetical protein